MSDWHPDDDRPLEDWEYPESDDPDDDVTPTIDCSACGATVYEDVPACPACGEYITRGQTIWDGRPVWWIVLGLAGMIALILVLLPF